MTDANARSANAPSANAESPVRLRTPGEVAAIVPYLTGFTPVESAVVISLKEPRGRVGLTMRCDLPPPGLDPSRQALFGRELVERLVRDKATRAILVVYTSRPDEGEELPREALVDGFLDELDRRRIRPTEVLLVREGLWSSYTCRESCCPRGGTEVADSEGSEPVTRAAAEGVLSGRQVLGTREELVESLAPVTPLGRTVAAAHFDAVNAALVAELEDDGVVATRRVTVGLVRGALNPRSPLSPGQKARVVVGLHDVLARDEVASLALEHPDALLTLLHELCRAALPPWDAPVCTVLAWTAYAQGEGALANVGLERALSTDPDYSLALLLDAALQGQLPPSEIRVVLAETAAAMALRGAGGAGSNPTRPPRQAKPRQAKARQVTGSGAARRKGRRRRRSPG